MIEINFTDENKKFEVSASDLIYQLTIPEIESLEIIYDPLDAAPNLPFGHLNHKWQKFIQDMKPEETIWSFRSEYNSWPGFTEIKEGYVLVNQGKIGNYFLNP